MYMGMIHINMMIAVYMLGLLVCVGVLGDHQHMKIGLRYGSDQGRDDPSTAESGQSSAMNNPFETVPRINA